MIDIIDRKNKAPPKIISEALSVKCVFLRTMYKDTSESKKENIYRHMNITSKLS